MNICQPASIAREMSGMRHSVSKLGFNEQKPHWRRWIFTYKTDACAAFDLCIYIIGDMQKMGLVAAKKASYVACEAS
jgi:hypothetical protein